MAFRPAYETARYSSDKETAVRYAMGMASTSNQLYGILTRAVEGQASTHHQHASTDVTDRVIRTRPPTFDAAVRTVIGIRPSASELYHYPLLALGSVRFTRHGIVVPFLDHTTAWYDTLPSWNTERYPLPHYLTQDNPAEGKGFNTTTFLFIDTHDALEVTTEHDLNYGDTMWQVRFLKHGLPYDQAQVIHRTATQTIELAGAPQLFYLAEYRITELARQWGLQHKARLGDPV